jgi:DNA-binding transcriptional ArsR family regulator
MSIRAHGPLAAGSEDPTQSSTNRLTIRRERYIFNHMVEDLAMNEVFHALASDARRDMLRRLAGRDLTVGQLAAPLAMSLAAASKHVQVLERAGLLRRTVDGRRHICRLEPAPLAAAQHWLGFYQNFWAERLDALQAMFQVEDNTKEDRNP